jgi:hypothetical protein
MQSGRIFYGVLWLKKGDVLPMMTAMNSKEIAEAVYCGYIQEAYGIFIFTD